MRLLWASVIACGALMSVEASQAAPLGAVAVGGANAKHAEIVPAGFSYGPCVWTYFRGWHQSTMLGLWRGCQPGPDWHYSQRCWIGPSNVRHCRYYG